MKYLSALLLTCFSLFAINTNAQKIPTKKAPIPKGKCTSTIKVNLKSGKLYNPDRTLSRNASYRYAKPGMVITAKKEMKDKDLQWMVFPFKSMNPDGKIVGLRFEYTVKPASSRSKAHCYISQSRIAQGTLRSQTVRLDDGNNLYVAKRKKYATRAFTPFHKLGNNYKTVSFRLAMTPKDIIILHKVEVLIECPQQNACDLKFRPRLLSKGAEKSVVRGKTFTKYNLAISNYNLLPKELFKAAPHLPACGRNANSSRTWIDIVDMKGNKLYGFCALGKPSDLKKLWFSVPKGKTAPKAVRVKIHDRECNKIYTSNLIKLPKRPKKSIKINPSKIKMN